jgi:hypothetical protein
MEPIMDIIKPTGNELSANSTLNTYSNTRLVKVITPATNSVATRYSNVAGGNVPIANTTLLANTEYFLAKEPTEQWAFSANVLLTPIAFQS